MVHYSYAVLALSFLLPSVVSQQFTLISPGVVMAKYDYSLSSASALSAAIFADYNAATEAEGLVGELAILPAEVSAGGDVKAWKFTTNNHADDVYCGLKSLVSFGDFDSAFKGAKVHLSFDVTLASNSGYNCIGVGGSPGESVFFKVGATPAEPLTTQQDSDYWSMGTSVDKGNQGRGGPNGRVAGSLNNGVEGSCDSSSPFKAFGVSYADAIDDVRLDEAGGTWALWGADSGYEGVTTYYILQVQVTATIVGDYEPSVYTPCEELLGHTAGYCPITSLHNVPRFSWLTFSRVDANEFPTALDPMPEDYVAGVLFYPSLILLLGLVFFCVALGYNTCCARCHGRARSESSGDKFTRRGPLAALLVALAVVALSSFAGLSHVTKGFELAADDYDETLDLAKEIRVDAKSLEARGEVLTDAFNTLVTNDCPDLEALRAGIAQYSTAVESFSNLTSTVEPMLRSAVPEDYREKAQLGSVFVGFPLAFVAVNIFLTTFGCSTSFRNASCCTCRWCIYLSNFIGLFSIALLSVFCAMEFGYAISTSDFCVDPQTNLERIAENFLPEEQVALVNYYLTCQEPSPLGDDVTSAQLSLIDLKSGLEVAQKQSCNWGNYDPLYSAIDDTIAALGATKASVDCGEVNPLIAGAVYESFCSQLSPGVAFLGLSLLLTLCLLLPTVIVGRQFAERIGEIEGEGQTIELLDGVDRSKGGGSKTAFDKMNKYVVSY